MELVVLRRVLLVLFAVVCVAAGCRGSGLVEQPPSDPELTPPISVDPAPEQLAGLIMALRATSEKAATRLPEVAPLYNSRCPGTTKLIYDGGCYLGWCLQFFRSDCGEWFLRLTNPEGVASWYHNGVPMFPPN